MRLLRVVLIAGSHQTSFDSRIRWPRDCKVGSGRRFPLLKGMSKRKEIFRRIFILASANCRTFEIFFQKDLCGC